MFHVEKSSVIYLKELNYPMFTMCRFLFISRQIIVQNRYYILPFHTDNVWNQIFVHLTITDDVQNIFHGQEVESWELLASSLQMAEQWLTTQLQVRIHLLQDRENVWWEKWDYYHYHHQDRENEKKRYKDYKQMLHLALSTCWRYLGIENSHSYNSQISHMKSTES